MDGQSVEWYGNGWNSLGVLDCNGDVRQKRQEFLLVSGEDTMMQITLSILSTQKKTFRMGVEGPDQLHFQF